MKTPTAIEPDTENSAASAPDTVSAIDRALQVLATFDPGMKALGLTTISERTGLPKSTLLRIIATLMNRGYVRAIPDGRYQLGPAVLRLAEVYQRTVQPEDLIRPVLEELARETGESASFNVREENVQVCLYRVDSQHALRHHIRVGQCFPMDRGCAAAVLRTFSGEAGAQFDALRERVVVTTHGEQFPGTSGIAVPVFGLHQSLAGAMILSGPTSRFDAAAVERMEAL
jgi:DNA-binding IclR family transcriptional regulator